MGQLHCNYHCIPQEFHGELRIVPLPWGKPEQPVRIDWDLHQLYSYIGLQVYKLQVYIDP